MTIHFHIEYGTMFGEQLVLNIQEDDEEKLKLPICGCHLRWYCSESGWFSSERYDDCGWRVAYRRCIVCRHY
jgi:hypothetical protein